MEINIKIMPENVAEHKIARLNIDMEKVNKLAKFSQDVEFLTGVFL